MQPHFITCWGAESNQIWWVVCTHFEPLKLLIKWLWLRPVVSRTLHGWNKICKSSLREWDNSDNFLNDEHLSHFYSEFSFYLVAELNSAAAVACCAWKPELNNKLKNIRILFIYLFLGCLWLRMKAVQTKEATSQMMRDGTHHLRNLPAFAGNAYFMFLCFDCFFVCLFFFCVFIVIVSCSCLHSFSSQNSIEMSK